MRKLDTFYDRINRKMQPFYEKNLTAASLKLGKTIPIGSLHVHYFIWKIAGKTLA